MNVDTKAVKQLRERTGAGMMDCYRALSESGGNIEAAVDFLRKQGVVKAAKLAVKTANQGLIHIEMSNNHQFAIILELNCETDFVARSEDFQTFTQKVAKLASQHQVKDVTALLNLSFDTKNTVESAIKALAAKVGENVQLRRLTACASQQGIVGCYLHHQRVGALVALDQANEPLAQDIAMHIVAMNPIAISERDCPRDFLEREKKIFTEQAKTTGKPDHIIDKIIQGRLDKLLKEQTLLSQPFVKDNDRTIIDLLQDKNVNVLNFVRYEVGEGMK